MRSSTGVSLLLSLALVVPNVAAALDSGFRPPTAVFYKTDFPAATTPSLPNSWEIDSGSWSAGQGTYDSTAPDASAISTIFEYFPDPNGSPEDIISTNPYSYRARMLNQGTAATSLVGMVYSWSTNNYAEVVFSPTGTATVRRVINGTVSNMLSTTYNATGHVWFDVELTHGNNVTTIKVNGIEILHLQQSLPFGRVGLVTHNTTARFDKIALSFPFNDQPYTENFNSGLTQNWTTTGQWSVSGGTFDTTSVQAESHATPAVGSVSTQSEQTSEFTFRARMLNPYGGPGNLVGIQFLAGGDTQFGTPGTGEVVFSPTGVAKINLLYDGKTHTIATAPYNGRRNVWFDVRVDVTLGHVAVGVDGLELFPDVNAFPLIEGDIGLVTHWAPGQFDDVSFDNSGIFHPLSQTFAGALPTGWAISGTWDTAGGTLNDTSAKGNDIVATNCGCWDTDIDYHGRLLNQYGASGNLVGLIYNYQRPGDTSTHGSYAGLYAGDYYEVVFAPTGQAFMNRVLDGVRYRVASGTHNVPRNTWFDVDVLRQGTTTTVKVNGATIFNKVPQVQPSKGDVGVVAHWARSRFDNLTIADRPLR